MLPDANSTVLLASTCAAVAVVSIAGYYWWRRRCGDESTCPFAGGKKKAKSEWVLDS
jgi:hypothetical protein